MAEDRKSKTRPGVTRRQFEKGLVGSALVAAAGLGLPGKAAARRGRGRGKGGHRGAREIHTLHFDLSHAPSEDAHSHRLHVLGQRIPLRLHTHRSLEKALESQPALRRIPPHRITHYAANVSLSAEGVHRLFVSTRSRSRGKGILLVGMHIPHAARERAGLLGPRDEPVIMRRGHEIVLEDADGVYYGSSFPTAKSTVQHHPEVATVDPDVAAAIDPYFEVETVYDFASSITDQGPAYELNSFSGQNCIPDEEAQGWAALLPVTDAVGGDNSDMVYSCTSESDLRAAVGEVQSQILDDPTLKGVLYDFQLHGDEPDAAALGLGGGTAGLLPSITGYHHNLAWTDFSVDSSDGTKFSFLLWNVNLLWYGVYVTWLGLDGTPLSDPSRAPTDTLVGLLRSGNEVLMDGVDMESDERKWVRLLTAPAEIFGVPAGALIPTDIELQFPEGAAAAKIELMGLGAHGSVQNAWSLFPGAAISVVADFMVPMYLLTKGVGESESGSLNKVISENPTSVQFPMVLALVAALAAEGNADPESDLQLAGSLASLFEGVLNGFVKQGAEAFDSELFQAWLLGELTEEEVADSVPFLGWGLRALQVAGTLAGLAQSTAEVATNPLVIANTIHQSHTLRVTVKPDPQDSGFPATWTRGQVIVSSGDKKVVRDFDKADVDIFTDPDDNRPAFTYDAEDMPATGVDAEATVVLLSDSGWAAGSGSVDFTNSRTSVVDFEITIKENPVPITRDTVYTHSRVLAFDEGSGQYLWNHTSNVPAPFPDLECNGIGVCAPGDTALWVPGGVMGYSWQGGSNGIGDCEGGGAGSSVHRFQSVSVVRDVGTPNDVLKRMSCGFSRPTPPAFATTLPNDGSSAAHGDHFYLTPVSDVIDPTDPSVLPAEFHVRKVTLDAGTPLNPNDDMSWGRFRISPIDRLAYYHAGDVRYLFGLSTTNNKLARLKLSDAPVPTAQVTNNAVLMLGRGSNDARLRDATAFDITKEGALLVLQNISKAATIKAFDIDGKPWQIFDTGSGPTSVLPLQPEPTRTIVYLDIAVASSDLIWVLSYQTGGPTTLPTDPSAFRLDVYDYAGNRVMRQTGVPVARIAVDTFHNLYSLNYQHVLSGSGQAVSRTEPSVSDWLPSTP